MNPAPIPEQINLNPAARWLELVYADGARYRLSCEYLRVYSPSMEVAGLGELQVYKENVGIKEIQPLGQYAIRIFFDDGHKSGIYSWEHLYDLAVNHARYWQDYLDRLTAQGYRRPAANTPAV